uniref:RING-type domain-containing protein n=1 Tax=Rhabditophanes sp. KR3021 TaxID=114890 RepID=A0AC35TH98_9BILA
MNAIKVCKNCKTQSDLKPEMRMMINRCGHPICSFCVETLYARNSAPCIICQKVLKRHEFWEQEFDDPMIEKENYIRKKVKKVYCLKADCFESDREYNDYLEKIENLVFDMANDINYDECEKQLKQFGADNADKIENCRRRLDDDQLWVQKNLDQEALFQRRINTCHETDNQEKAIKKASKLDTKAVIDELRDSEIPAAVILERKRKVQHEQELAAKEEERKAKLEAKQQKKSKDVASFTAARNIGVAYVHKVPAFEFNGPTMPKVENLARDGYLTHVRVPADEVLAGGYTAEIPCIRALMECRIDLFSF